MGSVTSMQFGFANTEGPKVPRSQFNRSHGHKTTFDAGLLVPIYCDEVVPGDTFNLKMNTFARLATLQTPLMENLYLDTFFFFVPYRLVWDNFRKFLGEQEPETFTEYLIPKMVAPAVTGYTELSLSDYMGIPTKVPGLEHMSLFHRAYNLCWNEWFRDTALQNSVVVDKDDGPDDPADYVLLRRGKRKDYFTSALPWPQRGAAIDLPLGESAPVLGIAKDTDTWILSNKVGRDSTGQLKTYAYTTTSDGANGSDYAMFFEKSTLGNYPNIRADLSEATASTVNELRQAFQLQRMLEKEARGGNRYRELIQAHFGVNHPDQNYRTEYLGGDSTMINVNPVVQQSATSGSNYMGDLAAFGTASHNPHGFVKSFTEFGLVLGLACLRADLNYQSGLPKMFSRRDKYDLYWPSLANLGEQAILCKEIFAKGTSADDVVWGYQERFAEMRYHPNKISGLYRSNATASLDNWHLAEEFADTPPLAADFIEEDPPLDRVVAVTAEPHLLFDAFFEIKAVRPMPTFATPGMIDHF